MRQLTVSAVLAVAAVTGVTGCGGSSTSKTATGVKATASTATTPASSEPTTSPTSPTPEATQSETANPTAIIAKCGSAGVELGKAAALAQGAGQADSTQKMADAFKVIVDTIPAGKYRDAMRVVAAGYQQLAAATKGSAAASQSSPEYLKAVQETFGDPKFSEAAQLLGKYFAGGCKG